MKSGWLNRIVSRLYNRPDAEYIVSVIKVLSVGLLGLILYTTLDVIVAAKEHASPLHIDWPVGAHIGHLFIKYPVIGIVFKFVAFTSLPLAVFFARQWRKDRMLHRDTDLQRIKELTEEVTTQQAALEKERARFKQVVDLQIEYVSKHLPDGTLTFVNKALYQLMGHKSYNTLLGLNFYKMLEPEQAKRTRQIINSITPEHPRATHVERIRVPGRGSPVYVEWSNCGIFRNGKLYKVLAVGRDVTERVELENLVTYTEGQYRRLFRHMISGFAIHQIVCGMDGTPCDYIFLEVNPAFCRLFGFTKEQVINKRVLELMPNTEPSIITRFAQVAENGKADSFPCHFIDIGKWFQVTAFRNEPGQFAATFLEVTHQHVTDRTDCRERCTDKPITRKGR
jgi:PAS domain S-box-containing protein